MKLKSVALAAVLLGSITVTSPAKADFASDSAISSSLGLIDFCKTFGLNFFQSSLTSGGDFLAALTGVANTYTFGQIVEAFVNFGNAQVPGSLSTATFTGTYTVGPGPGQSWSTALNFDSTTGTIGYTGGVSGEVVPVPGPEAGAGIGALAMAGLAYVAMRRRKQQLAA